MSKSTIKKSERHVKSSGEKRVDNIRVPFEHRQLFQDYLRKICISGGVLK